MRKPEKAIVRNDACANERYQEAMKRAYRDVQNPYESEKHQEAQDYIKRRKIKVPKLRKEQ